MVPSDKDLDKFHKRKQSLLKYTEDGLSEKQMCSIIRSSVRKSWMRSPVRQLKMDLECIPDMDDSTRTKWLYPCKMCGEHFKGGDVQVDHIKGEHQLKTLADVEGFSRSILNVKPSDLQILCVPCHDVKTYAERYDMTLGDAKKEKDVIQWLDDNTVPAQKRFLIALGHSPSEVSNDDKRRTAYREFVNRKGEP